MSVSEQALRQKIAMDIFRHADELRQDDEDPITREERDSYYDAANFVLDGEWSE